MKTISISIKLLSYTHAETIFTGNSIGIINHLVRNASIFVIKATETYLCYTFLSFGAISKALGCAVDTSFWSSFHCLPPVLYPNQCYNEVCYKGTALFLKIYSIYVINFKLVHL